MIEFIALVALSLRLSLNKPVHRHVWVLDGIGIDGSVFEVCQTCTRVRVYLVDRDGDPVGIYEFDKTDMGESTSDAVLREYESQEGKQ